MDCDINKIDNFNLMNTYGIPQISSQEITDQVIYPSPEDHVRVKMTTGECVSLREFKTKEPHEWVVFNDEVIK